MLVSMWGDKMTRPNMANLRRCDTCQRETVTRGILCNSNTYTGCKGKLRDVSNIGRKRNIRTLGDLDG